MKVRFNIEYHTQWGQELCIRVLSSLSHNDVDDIPFNKTFPLEYVDNGKWHKEIDLPENKHFQYYYILQDNNTAFINNEVSEYTNPLESEHDFFIMGHTSPAVSMCCGLAKGRDLKGEKNNVIAVVGDGALSGGEAFEGLDNIAEIGTNMIVVVNDNQWSIAESHGGIYRNFKELRESNGQAPCNYFKALGLDYIYIDKGNDLQSLIDVFKKVKDIDHPIVIHINTLKGEGYKPAIQHAEQFHYMPPFDLKTGKPLHVNTADTYTALTGTYLIEEMKKNPLLVAISSATPSVFNFSSDVRKAIGKQFVDVGIAEEHAVAFSSGLAKSGVRPVYGVFGTFLQRAFDQLSEDLCMNRNPAVVLIFLTGVYGMPDQSHQCFFDIIEISNIPNMVYLAPICKEEYFAMLAWSIKQTEHPVAIRVPTNGVHSIKEEFDTDYSELNRFKMMQQGEKVAVIAVGSFFSLGQSVVEELEQKHNIKATLISPRYLSGVDQKMLEQLKNNHQVIITLEDGIIEGGYGEKIAGYYGPSQLKVINYGFKKEFIDRYNASQLMEELGLTREKIAQDVTKYL